MVKSCSVVRFSVLSHTLTPFVNVFYIFVLPIRFPDNGTWISWTIIQFTDRLKTSNNLFLSIAIAFIFLLSLEASIRFTRNKALFTGYAELFFYMGNKQLEWKILLHLQARIIILPWKWRHHIISKPLYLPNKKE